MHLIAHHTKSHCELLSAIDNNHGQTLLAIAWHHQWLLSIAIYLWAICYRCYIFAICHIWHISYIYSTCHIRYINIIIAIIAVAFTKLCKRVVTFSPCTWCKEKSAVINYLHNWQLKSWENVFFSHWTFAAGSGVIRKWNVDWRPLRAVLIWLKTFS